MSRKCCKGSCLANNFTKENVNRKPVEWKIRKMKLCGYENKYNY